MRWWEERYHGKIWCGTETWRATDQYALIVVVCLKDLHRKGRCRAESRTRSYKHSHWFLWCTSGTLTARVGEVNAERKAKAAELRKNAMNSGTTNYFFWVGGVLKPPTVFLGGGCAKFTDCCGAPNALPLRISAFETERTCLRPRTQLQINRSLG